MICWRALINYLPIEDNLLRKGYGFASRCVLCKANVEDGVHLFIGYPFSSTIWKAITNIFGRRIQVSGSLVDLILDVMNHGFSSQILALWTLAIVYDILVIWRIRNAVI